MKILHVLGDKMFQVLLKLAIGKSNNTLIQFLRFCVVGTVATAVDMGIFFILTEKLGIYYLISNIFSFICGLLTNFVLSYIWVFTKKGESKKIYDFTLFSAIGLVGLGFNSAIIFMLVEFLRMWEMYAKAIATGVVLFWNFFARKKFVFDN